MVSIHLRRGRKQGCPKVLVILWIFCSEYISRMCGVIVAVALELAGQAIAGPGSNYWAAPLLLLLLDTSPSHLGIYTFHGDFLLTFFLLGQIKTQSPDPISKSTCDGHAGTLSTKLHCPVFNPAQLRCQAGDLSFGSVIRDRWPTAVLWLPLNRRLVPFKPPNKWSHLTPLQWGLHYLQDTVLGWVSLHWGRGQWVCTPLPLTGLIHTHMQIAADPGQVFI